MFKNFRQIIYLSKLLLCLFCTIITSGIFQSCLKSVSFIIFKKLFGLPDFRLSESLLYTDTFMIFIVNKFVTGYFNI